MIFDLISLSFDIRPSISLLMLYFLTLWLDYDISNPVDISVTTSIITIQVNTFQFLLFLFSTYTIFVCLFNFSSCRVMTDTLLVLQTVIWRIKFDLHIWYCLILVLCQIVLNLVNMFQLWETTQTWEKCFLQRNFKKIDMSQDIYIWEKHFSYLVKW